MEEKDRLQDIPQFRTLEENLELRVALQQVDKLKAENLALKVELDEIKDEIIKMPGVVMHPIEDDEDVEDRIMPESIQEEINMNELNEQSVQEELDKENEQAVLNAEDPNYPTRDDLEDWTPPSYEDVVDPEFDRGFKMGQDWLIDDIIQYLKNIRNNGEA